MTAKEFAAASLVLIMVVLWCMIKIYRGQPSQFNVQKWKYSREMVEQLTGWSGLEEETRKLSI